MKNYLTYPCKAMNITQSYSGSYSHDPHTKGSPSDYPWDEACENTGRSPMYCPCDEMKIVRIYTTGSNTIWLESTSKVYLADGTNDFVVLMVTHPNDSDIKKLKVGQKFKRNDIICYEGTDGNATGNHFHFSIGKGKIKGNGWTQNSKGKWVLTTTNGAKKPEKMFYVDGNFTKIKSAKLLSFKMLPQDDFFDGKKYFKKGDTHANIGKIAKWLRNMYPSYTPEAALGNYFGNNLYKAVKEFQRRTEIEADGNIGPITLATMEKNGFKKG